MKTKIGNRKIVVAASKTRGIRNDRKRFNVFLFISTFARSLIEGFISLYLFKNGFSIQSVLMFYLLGNLFSLFTAYFFVRIGERYSYSLVMYIGVIAFVVLQLVLSNLVHDFSYIVLISFLYAVYRRGYWVARRFYITEIMPQRGSSIPYSVVMIVLEMASIVSGFFGGMLLDNVDTHILLVLSSGLLFVSVLPLLKIRSSGKKTKIELIKNLKRYDKRNYLAFSLYEISNLLGYIFPIYVYLYIEDTYTMTGAMNAFSGFAIVAFIFFYGRVIKNRNFFVISSMLAILASLTKLMFLNYFILALCFIEGIVKKMQAQSLGKIYFENRNNMDLAHYNLIYQLLESLARAIVTIPLLFMNSTKIMILFVLLVMSAELVIYTLMKKDKRLD